VLDPEILAQLDRLDPTVAKPANIKRLIQTQFGKEISYAQLAYEMSKRKSRATKWAKQSKLKSQASCSQIKLSGANEI